MLSNKTFQTRDLVKSMNILDMSYLEDTSPETQELLSFQQTAMEKAVQRLNKYIGSLKLHILSIVQCESEEFLSMADRLTLFDKYF